MANNQASALKRPSEAYNEATLSIVYRLSELMFGSLLAAYALGFVGALGAHGDELWKHGIWGAGLLTVQYASISVAFAYLTTSFYLTYHAGILTMPQMPFQNLGEDFKLAIAQAVFFGLSMLQPALFPILLGLNFYKSGKRKNEEYETLAEELYKDICERKGRKNPDERAKFYEELTKLLRSDFPELSGWGPMGADIRRGGIRAATVGSIVIAIYIVLEILTISFQLDQRWPWWLELKWVSQQGLIAIEVLLATKAITKYGVDVVRKRAEFLGFPIKNTEFGSHEKGETSVNNVDNLDGEDHKSSKLTSTQAFRMDEEYENLRCRLKAVCART
jgi:hypothetical protein